MPSVMVNFRVPMSELEILERAVKYAEMERTTLSAILRSALKEYVKKHGDGNPQLPLIPSTRPLYVNPVMEARRDVMAELLYDIRKAGGRATPAMITYFARIHGLRVKTVRQMEAELKREGAI